MVAPLIDQPRTTDLADVREHIITQVLATLPAGAHAQGTDAAPARDIAPFDFGLDAQGEILRHLTVGCVITASRIVRGRGRDGTHATAQTTLMLRVSYRVRPHQQEEDYQSALRLMSALPRTLFHAIHTLPAQVEIVEVVDLAIAPARTGEPYLLLTIAATLAHPLEV